ncbi:ribonuclease PH [Candidatus Omnitrophota bacterium]
MSRIDKRKPDQLRKIKLKRQFLKYPEGSCLIELGDTKVICTASVEENLPVFLRGKKGSGWITAEYGMLPRSTESRMQREKKSGRTHEIRRLIGRSLRSVVDLKKIGERTIWIDCDVIQADGGTRTASISGGFVALVDCLAKLKQQGRIREMPVADYLGAVSVGILEKEALLDLNYHEDSRADIDMNVVMNSAGRFVEVQGTAEKESFSKKTLDTMLDLAKKGIDDIFSAQRALLKDVFMT